MSSLAWSSNFSVSGLRRVGAGRLSGFASVQCERIVCNGGTNTSRGVVTMAGTGKDVRCSIEGQGQTQTIKNETILENKAPLQSKGKSPKLDDGGTGLPPRDGDGGGGGGGGGGGWGGGGFVFWALLLLIGFLRDRELDKPYTGPKRKKKQKKRQFT